MMDTAITTVICMIVAGLTTIALIYIKERNSRQ